MMERVYSPRLASVTSLVYKVCNAKTVTERWYENPDVRALEKITEIMFLGNEESDAVEKNLYNLG